MRLHPKAGYLASYWREVSDGAQYEVQIEGDFTRPLLLALSERIVGGAVEGGPGTVLYLPPLSYDEEEFIREDETQRSSYWTESAVQFGRRLASTLRSLHATLTRGAEGTPPPAWVGHSRYRLKKERELELKVTSCAQQIKLLQEDKLRWEWELAAAGSLRALLFEQGKPLEAAIIETLHLMGFDAEPYDDGTSEFDAVFLSPEGRCLGEAEGKDRRKVNIDKFSQLERNIQEDFAREEVSEFAKGVLFGNAHRLTPPEERDEDYFTEKCYSAARRANVALVRTPDMFGPAQYLRERKNRAYAKRCRKAIFGANGEVVLFPDPPQSHKKALKESDGG